MTFKFIKSTEQFDKFINKTVHIRITYLLLFAFLADILISCIFSFILFPDHTAGPVYKATAADFLLIVIVAPLLETFLVQSWIIKQVLKYSNNNRLMAVIISATIFGLAHYYSVPYILKAFIAGILYGLLFVTISCKGKNPFWYIALTHSAYNCIGFVLNAISV
jgi:uncharacterized membrane protein (DUF373 family)